MSFPYILGIIVKSAVEEDGDGADAKKHRVFLIFGSATLARLDRASAECTEI